jgi:uncharacterized protein involved in exopolysaccharide biosynthesis
MQTYIKTGKLTALLRSRKFWALVTTLVTLGVGVGYHAMPPDQAILAAVVALSTYSLATAHEDNGLAQAKPPTGLLPPRG